MNETLRTILTRRSVRAFKSDEIDQHSVEMILRAGMSAPSAYNAQPWHFIVINDRKALSEDIPQMHPYAQMAKQAPLAILVCSSTLPPKPQANAYWQQDSAACCENMLLAAHSLGIGGVWTGVYPNPLRLPLFKEYFKLPQDIEPIALLIFGIPDQNLPKTDRFHPEKIHYGTW